MSADGVVARGFDSSQGGPGRDDRVEMMMGVGRRDDRVERKRLRGRNLFHR